MELTKKRVPHELIHEAPVTGIAFTPITEPYIASSLVDGHIIIHQYSVTEENKVALSLKPFKHACRAIAFSDDGSMLFCGGRDTAIKEIDLNKGVISWGQGKAHESSISCMKMNFGYLATGDDEGAIKVWDQKSKKQIYYWEEHEDYISDIIIQEDKLIASSADGSLSVYDIKAGKFQIASTNVKSDEFLSMSYVKNDTLLIVGCQTGCLRFFAKDEWGYQTSGFSGHPEAVDAMLTINEDMIATGSCDGLIRLINIRPNRFMGVIGEHPGYPIERLSLSKDLEFIASSSHDYMVKFWNISSFWSGEHTSAETEHNRERQLQRELRESKLNKRTRDHKNFFRYL